MGKDNTICKVHCNPVKVYGADNHLDGICSITTFGVNSLMPGDAYMR